MKNKAVKRISIFIGLTITILLGLTFGAFYFRNQLLDTAINTLKESKQFKALNVTFDSFSSKIDN